MRRVRGRGIARWTGCWRASSWCSSKRTWGGGSAGGSVGRWEGGRGVAGGEAGALGRGLGELSLSLSLAVAVGVEGAVAVAIKRGKRHDKQTMKKAR